MVGRRGGGVCDSRREVKQMGKKEEEEGKSKPLEMQMESRQ